MWKCYLAYVAYLPGARIFSEFSPLQSNSNSNNSSNNNNNPS
jgi:hypothetical protein